MPKKNCYAIKDEKIGVFQSPHFTTSVVDALRSLTIAANQPESNLNRFPEDYSLYHLGDIDEETGILTAITNGPLLITSVKKLINKTKGQPNEQ